MYREHSRYKFQLIGGGSYGDKLNQIKQGKWAELQDQFQFFSNIIYYGEFKNGIKVGRWNIYFQVCSNYQFKFIGGGTYDYGCQGKKVGKWTLSNNGYFFGSQITLNGKYMYGKKVGRWDIFFKHFGQGQEYVRNQQIGGGIYQNKGEDVKVGYWIELWERFDSIHNVILNGEYKMVKRLVDRIYCIVLIRIFHTNKSEVDFMMIKGLALRMVNGLNGKMIQLKRFMQFIKVNINMERKQGFGIFSLRTIKLILGNKCLNYYTTYFDQRWWII
ncbi:unnamed protein product [Paramecium octaurelia]|uniref:Uncharacterized protein n=1 Tax=Paramecium octaurelia TaxID=43137 RepID=A0A8S1YNJ4_PAROT|nr:unnamed protein product [Paramecium octaurelia]